MLSQNTQEVTGTGRMSAKMQRAVPCLGPRAQHRTDRTLAAVFATVVIFSLLPWIGRGTGDRRPTGASPGSALDTASRVKSP